MKEYLPVVLTIFLAELGDKTQLATLLFAAEGRLSPLGVFVSATLALTAAAAVGVLAGSLFTQYLQGLPLKLIAGIGFILIGAWTVYGHFQGA